jgi:hypothetical protein
MCVCGKPETLGVVHSLDNPCFNYQPPDPRADAFAREFFISAIAGNKAAADAASEKLLRYVLSVPPTLAPTVKAPSVSTDKKKGGDVQQQTDDLADEFQTSPTN